MKNAKALPLFKNRAEEDLPDWLKNRPVLPVHLVWFMESFWELHTCRQMDQGVPCSIPWDKIKEYAEYYDINFSYFLYIIRSLDSAYQKYVQEEREKEEKKQTQQNKRPRK